MNNDYHVYIVPLPDHVSEMVTTDPDGYTIYLSDKLDSYHLQKEYKHAVSHIENGDLDNRDGNVQEIESQAHVREDSEL